MRYATFLYIVIYASFALSSCQRNVDMALSANEPTASSNFEGHFTNMNPKDLGVYYRPLARGYFSLFYDEGRKCQFVSKIGQGYVRSTPIDAKGKFVLEYADRKVEFYADDPDDRFYYVNGDEMQFLEYEREFTQLVKGGEGEEIKVSFYYEDELRHTQILRIQEANQFTNQVFDEELYASMMIVQRSEPQIHYEIDPDNENGILFVLSWTGGVHRQSFDEMMSDQGREGIKWLAYYEKETGVVEIPNDVLEQIPDNAYISVSLKRNDAVHYEMSEKEFPNLIHFMTSSTRTRPAILINE